MNQDTLNKLEYPRIIEELHKHTVTFAGKALVQRLTPHTDLQSAALAMAETADAKRIVDRSTGLPLPTLQGLELPLSLFGKGYIMSIEDLGQMAQFIRSCGHWKQFLIKREEIAPVICSYVHSLHDLEKVLDTIEQAIAYGQIADSATPELHKLRRKIRNAEERVKKRMDALMHKYRNILQESIVSQRGGRFVIPVKKEFRKQISGTPLDESASGQTVYIEPYELSELQQELSGLRAEESAEEIKIRSDLTDLVEAHAYEIGINVETIAHYDFLFAKAKYALRTGAGSVKLNDRGMIRLKEAVHPFLTGKAVPLDVSIGGSFRALIITGPNTGGKTVTLKTVGLLTLMAQSGMLVPAHEDSELAVFQAVEADIGDNQSIDESLSTFSSHIRTIIRMLKEAGPRTLILLDELAAGTDPGEGIGLSIAVLEELAAKKATIIATTHFNEIKTFASQTAGFENARMEFDLETLLPLYRLTIGEAGKSYALHIAARLGIHSSVIERAKILASMRQNDRSGIIENVDEPSKFTEHIIENEPGTSSIKPATGAAPIRSGSQMEGQQSEEALRSNGGPTIDDSTTATGKVWEVGDRVFIPYLKRAGVIYRTPDEMGNLVIIVQNEKHQINIKRIKPYIDRKHLYPDGYDMDILFESKENRKKRKQMSKHHMEGMTIEIIHEENERGKSK
ncbi:MAG: DNA mismatch repair protein MutS [Gorillibacterium sp.]|nr:DNA mismatch repair protein MutS [Gorillibacterium sp.]